MNSSVCAVRNAVRYVRSSPARLLRFKQCVKNVNKEEKALVYLDVPTQQNSTYLMIEYALRFVDSFKLMEDDNGYFLLWFMKKEANGEEKG